MIDTALCDAHGALPNECGGQRAENRDYQVHGSVD